MRRKAGAEAALIRGRRGLTCNPGSAPNIFRRASAPRACHINTNCLKEFGIVMRYHTYCQNGSLPATTCLAATTRGSDLLNRAQS
jgi:hypothetical protein